MAIRLLMPAAIVGVGVIVVLSLLPGSLRPHTAASGNVEHWVAYLMTAGAVGLARRAPLGWRGPAAFSALAAAMEIVQIFVPGRTPGVDNWAASTCGAVIGLALAAAIRARFAAHRKGPASRV